MPENIIQFQVIPHSQGDGQTVYVLTSEGRIYFSNSVVSGGAWHEFKQGA